LRTRRVASLGLALTCLGACKRDWISIPAGPQQLVLHGVLSPADTMQIVLLERTLTGTVTTPIVWPFQPAVEPILSDYGVPESGATTQITTPDGTVIAGSELPECFEVPPRLCNGSGGGVYKFFLRGSTLVPGGRYAFRAVTTRGEVITAETVFPETPRDATTINTTFNRTTDTLSLVWPASPRAPAYQVRVENMFGSWSSFTDSTRVALAGSLRNPDQARLPHVFLPGFRQLLTVTAVDANLYDYYRTSNNSFIGYGAVSRVNGAFGVFGSAVTVLNRNVTVTANQTQPIEGTFDGVDTGLGYIYFTDDIELFVESPATRKNEADAITGSGGGVPLIGTFKDGLLRLAFLRNLARPDTVELLTAELRGDTLVGSYRLGAPARFVKRK
jgi:hypothetical protein